MTLASIAVGGAVGSVLRYLIQEQCIQWWGTKFPFGTLLVNAVGSLLIGVLSIVLIERWVVADEIRIALFVGLLGGFTTFSAFSLETLYLIQQGSFLSATANIALNILLCIGACFLGMNLARSL
ncbi:MAG: fluoride efflux transporter CrcB [Gammaproteobacteria bacterium]|nr:fluoride efflux transporter CrcB [Gammaproteobacteria bacterium]